LHIGGFVLRELWEVRVSEVTGNPNVLARSMINTYGQDAERQARNYALGHQSAGRAHDYMLWLEVVSIIVRRQKLLKSLDS
jgi:hypothetical protein